MKEDPEFHYKNFFKNFFIQLVEHGLNVQEILAVQRTLMAVERTLLAYLRTAFALFIAGLTFIKVFPALSSQIWGWIFIVVGVITMILGFLRYRQMNHVLFRTIEYIRPLRYTDKPIPLSGEEQKLQD